MSLRFIYGRAGSGKSRRCLEEIKERVDSDFGKKLVLLIPEQFSFQASKNLINTVGERVATKAQVLSFTRLAYVVFSEVGGITRQLMNPAGKNMLIYRIIDEIKDELKVFKRAGRQQGFVNIIGDIITEFKRYDVNPDLLRIVSGNIKENTALYEKMQDINLIYDIFEKTLHKNYIDSEDELLLLAEKLEHCTLFDGAEIWIDEFSSFTPLQYKIIEKLLKKASRVNITLNTDCLIAGGSTDNTDVFAPIKNTERKLLKFAEDNNIAYEKPLCLEENLLPRFKSSKELAHLEKYFFYFPYNQYKEDTLDISVFKALNMYTEIQNVAREIIALTRDKSFRLNDIAVITRDLDSYEKLVQAIFNEYEIPYFIDKKRDINGNPLVILLNSVIDIFSKGWSYEAVFRYLKTGLTGIEQEDIDLIENYVLANGIKGKKWTEEKWNYRFNYGFQSEEISEIEQETIDRVNEIKNRITEPLMRLNKKIKNRKNVRDMCTAIYELFEELNCYENIEKWISEFKEDKDLDMANEYSQIWNIVIELLDQIVEVMGEEKLTMDEFVKVLTTGINECEIGVIPPSLDQVLVGSIDRIRSHDVSALFIIGVNDGVFPKASNEEGILSDKDREELKELGLELALDTKAQAFEEQFLIYNSLTLSSKYLKISYPIANFEGKTMRPSIIISRLKKVFPNIKEDSDIIKLEDDVENLKAVTGASSTFNELIAAIRGKAEGEAASAVWWDVYSWYKEKPEWKERCIRTFEGLSYSNQVKFVNEKKIRKLYGSPLQFSVSRLERFSQCPFAYYVEYGLKAKQRKIYEFSPPDLGSFIHEVLDEFSEILEKESITWREIEDQWCDEAISLIVDKKVNERTGSILSSSPRYKYMSERLKRIMTKSVNLIAQHIKKSGFDPIGYEMSFGKNGDFPPITVDLPSGDKIELIGRIDRVDELQTEEGLYLRIIDYKSGNKSFKLSDVYYGLQLQLLVYLDAVLSNQEKYIEKGILPGAMLYFRIDDPIVSVKKEMSEEEIQKEVMKTLKMKGLLLKDAKVIKAMDKDIDGYSLIIPAQILKSGEVSSKSSAATLEQFELLRKYVRHILIDLCEEMLNGNISIKPYKKKDSTPCEYCSFSAVCQFDTSIKDNKYKYLNDRSDEEVWELMKKEVEKEVK
ncbi:helicase-exonuclease AddAB subunit AddB [Clostridium omnivorum]|uniref:ATP-dependent helicase/deoxyribonuclease subunit B n=1 Tax=Clostridium omnivorum TaxID=1604902 RepID=A0ABQ5N7T0_9CLOT|nr:helicase-exonuclease AddAB subunit AddB [Clostridium sp. E14]GLC31308.1 ATP-dependent helicase/deoxyribonuclease subunit B [Clostridium sp. E14]